MKRLLQPTYSPFSQPKIQDTSKPNLLREIYPYIEVPRTQFDNKILPLEPAQQMFITDTTFRDGQQAQPPFTVKQICDLYDLLHKLGGPKGAIRSSEFFLYTKKDKEAVIKCLEKSYQYPKVTGWIRAQKEDIKLVKEMGLNETGILTSVSDYHIFYKLNLNRKQALEQYLAIVEEALAYNIVPRCHFEDITRADIYGFCVPFAFELMRLRERIGVDIKIRLCDTLGYGIPHAQAALPRSVPKIVRAMIDDGCVPGHLLEWHGHNDFYKALINGVTAWLYGCTAVNGTLLGIGERTGNTPIEALVIELISLEGNNLGIDTTVITDIALYFEKEIKYRIQSNHPFVGEHFNETKAGIHIDGLSKNKEIYTIFDTEKILKRPITISITDKSGTSGIAYWINNRLKLKDDKEIDKKHPGVLKIYKYISQQYEEGRITPISHEEMFRLVKKYLPHLFVSELDILKQRVEKTCTKLIKSLITKTDITSMNPKKQEPMLRKFLEENPFIQFIYVTDPQGKKITRNITHIINKAKYEEMKLGEDLSNRDWFIMPMKTGKIFVSSFYISRFTGALCLTISAPIIEKEEILGVLGADIKFEDALKIAENGSI
jgi:isopropylmalate/homocitrate/citramalate synthase